MADCIGRAKERKWLLAEEVARSNSGNLSSHFFPSFIAWGIQPIRRFVMFGVQWEASSSIISKPLITPKDINKLGKAQTKNSRELDKHAQTSSSGFAKKYTRFQFILQCFPGLEWDHEGKTCWINIPPETPTAWLVLSGFNLHFFGEHGGICVLDGLPPQQVDPTQVAELPCAPKCRHNGTIWI